MNTVQAIDAVWTGKYEVTRNWKHHVTKSWYSKSFIERLCKPALFLWMLYWLSIRGIYLGKDYFKGRIICDPGDIKCLPVYLGNKSKLVQKICFFPSIYTLINNPEGAVVMLFLVAGLCQSRVLCRRYLILVMTIHLFWKGRGGRGGGGEGQCFAIQWDWAKCEPI